jgi:branched-chain amino acid transport system ATP-binding protein
MSDILLEITGLHAGYGDLEVLHGVDLAVPRGEIVSVVGANGAGKSTLLGTIAGVVRPTAGSIVIDGVDITGIAAHKVVGNGVALVPEGRKLFPFLTVEENLRLGGFHKAARVTAKATMDEVFELFPRLADRRTQLAGSLSGGEQQMAAIGRGIMAKPQVLMLDEPSLGLAPAIVEGLYQVLEQGTVAMTGSGAELLADPSLQKAYLGVV